jgi:hypothetical protein
VSDRNQAPEKAGEENPRAIKCKRDRKRLRGETPATGASTRLQTGTDRGNTRRVTAAIQRTERVVPQERSRESDLPQNG